MQRVWFQSHGTKMPCALESGQKIKNTNTKLGLCNDCKDEKTKLKLLQFCPSVWSLKASTCIQNFIKISLGNRNCSVIPYYQDRWIGKHLKMFVNEMKKHWAVIFVYCRFISVPPNRFYWYDSLGVWSSRKETK